MPFEDEFSHALREAADAAPPPPLERLAVGAQQRGRRRRQRRVVVASAAAVAVLAAGGTLALRERPSATAAGPGPVAATAGPTSPGTASPTPSPSPTPVASSSATPMTADQMLALLRGRLPAGLQLSNPMGQGTEPTPNAMLQMTMAAFTITDNRGSGGVELIVSRSAPSSDLASNSQCAPTPHGATPTCTSSALPGGGYLRVNLPARAAGGEQVWTADLWQPDGVHVEASAGNLPGPGTRANGPTRDAPVLNGDQLTALALDPVWQPVGAALSPPKPVTSQSPDANSH